MSKFNKKSEGTKTVNLAGGVAYSQSPELELVSLVLTSFVQDSFYEGKDENLNRLTGLVNSIQDKKFLGQTAIYARTKFGMRSITHALLAEIAKHVKGQEWTKNAIANTIYRVDDVMETLAYYGNKYGKPFPNSLKKGVALGLQKFDSYQLGKYRGSGKDVKLVDVLNLVHPKPSDKQNDAFKKLVDGDLKSTDTWESQLSEAGKVEADTEEEKEVKVAENKKEVWANLLKSDKLGYFALLRNIRNILEQSPDVIDLAIEKLTNKELIKKSLIMPFQFKKAYDAVNASATTKRAEILKALNVALDLSVDNCPVFDGKTLIALDMSGSMSGQPREIGTLFAAVLAKRNPNADLMVFHDVASYARINPNSLLGDIINQIPMESGGTNFNEIFRVADKAYDRIIILSDMQAWMSPRDSWSNIGGAPTRAFDAYKSKFNANPKIFSFDLKGYGSLQFPQNNIYAIAGFSDKTLELMKLLEQDRNILLNEIKQIKI